MENQKKDQSKLPSPSFAFLTPIMTSWWQWWQWRQCWKWGKCWKWWQLQRHTQVFGWLSAELGRRSRTLQRLGSRSVAFCVFVCLYFGISVYLYFGISVYLYYGSSVYLCLNSSWILFWFSDLAVVETDTERQWLAKRWDVLGKHLLLSSSLFILFSLTSRIGEYTPPNGKTYWWLGFRWDHRCLCHMANYMYETFSIYFLRS